MLPPIQGYDYQARYYAEEHALFDTDPGFPAQIGDRTRLICGYAPTTVNLHDVIFAIDGDQVAGRLAGLPARAGSLRDSWTALGRPIKPALTNWSHRTLARNLGSRHD